MKDEEETLRTLFTIHHILAPNGDIGIKWKDISYLPKDQEKTRDIEDPSPLHLRTQRLV